MNAAADPPTDVRQQTLVKFAVGQVERAARDVVRRYGPALKPRDPLSGRVGSKRSGSG